MAEDMALVAAWPGVVEAANLIGSTQIQGRCTIVGNLCNASTAAESVLVLAAADAQVTIVGPNSLCDVDIHETLIGLRKTSLKNSEIIKTVLLPHPSA